MDNSEPLLELYQQCSTEIKKKKRFLGPLQIHHETMQLLTNQPSFIESEAFVGKDKTNKVSSSWKVDPILAIRSIFSPRPTDNKDDCSKMVLPGRRITLESDVCGSGGIVSKMWKQHQELEFEGFSDLDYDTLCGGRRPRCTEAHSNSIVEVTDPDGFSSSDVLHGEALDVTQIPGERDTPGRPRKKLGIRRSTLFAVNEKKASVDHDDCRSCELRDQQDTPIRPRELLGKCRSSFFVVGERRVSVDHADCGGECFRGRGGGLSYCKDSIGNEVLRRRSSIEGKDGMSLICEFPPPPSFPACRGKLICDWGRQQSNVSSESSLSSSEELNRGLYKNNDESQAVLSTWTTPTDEKLLQHALRSCSLRSELNRK